MVQAERLVQFQEYPFAERLRRCLQLEQEGHEVLNLGIGSPDLAPHPRIIETLNMAAQQATAHGYQSSWGTQQLRQSISKWYQRIYDADLNPENEILPLMGSKEGIYLISLALVNPGESVLLPDPGYMNYRQGTLLAGGTPVSYPLRELDQWRPDLEKLNSLASPDVKLCWINYPHMPTGACLDSGHLRDMVQWAREKGIILINDNPYSLLASSPRSLLQECSCEGLLELNSLSKAYHMAGWRVGMLCGDHTLIDPVYRLNSFLHSGMFLPIQEAVISALQLDDSWRIRQNQILKDRRKAVEDLLKHWTINIAPDQEGLFVWGRLPENPGHANEFVDRLLETQHILLTPGTFFGSQCQDYVRASICVDAGNIRKFHQSMIMKE